MDVSISPELLASSLDGTPSPLLIDLRAAATAGTAGTIPPGAIRREPERLRDWAGDLEIGRPVALYDTDGRQAAAALAETLWTHGVAAHALGGGFAGWAARRLPVRPKPTGADDQRMLRHSLVVYHALYAWCRSLQGERHNWPPTMPASAGAV